jgi:hypothetical protein
MALQLEEKTDHCEEKTDHGGQHSAEEHDCAEQSVRTAGSESLSGAAEETDNAPEQRPEADFEQFRHSKDYTAVA